MRPTLWFALGLAASACAPLPAHKSELPLRVMTYNIRAGNDDLERIVQTIRDVGAEVVALQEVDVHWSERSGFADQATLLGERLRMQVRFARIYHLPNPDTTKPAREFGIALLSKHPILTWSNHTLTRLSTQEANPVAAPLPGFLEATIDLAGTPVRIFNTHLDYRSDPRVRQQQVAEMLAYVGEPSTPTILLGDFNASPDAPELQPLLQRLWDAWAVSAGDGFTYPADKPAKRIDYVLTSTHFRILSARVPVTEASDHRPVVVDLLLLRGRQNRYTPSLGRHENFGRIH